jgi:hypothetical protein
MCHWILSDLHLEDGVPLPSEAPDFDVLVCAGDVAEGSPARSVEAVARLARGRPAVLCSATMTSGGKLWKVYLRRPAPTAPGLVPCPRRHDGRHRRREVSRGDRRLNVWPRLKTTQGRTAGFGPAPRGWSIRQWAHRPCIGRLRGENPSSPAHPAPWRSCARSDGFRTRGGLEDARLAHQPPPSTARGAG